MDIKRLLAELTDPDEETRAAILDEISLEMDDEIAQALLDIAASDAAEGARTCAIVAFGPVIEECGNDYMEGGIDFGPEMGPSVSREMFASIVAGSVSCHCTSAPWQAPLEASLGRCRSRMIQ